MTPLGRINPRHILGTKSIGVSRHAPKCQLVQLPRGVRFQSKRRTDNSLDLQASRRVITSAHQNGRQCLRY